MAKHLALFARQFDSSTPKSVGANIQRLIETRALVYATSGGGKSYALRVLLEQTARQVQQIIIDPEGEFASLREIYDRYAIFGPRGRDAVANPETAPLLARKLRETGLSAIIDIYDLEQSQRILFVQRFLNALINCPRELWKYPALVVLDEAQMFAPERGFAASQGAVIDLCTRGRKRGLGAVLATQRLSNLNKNAAAQLLNKLIGLTVLDIDVKRAADELGMNAKDAMAALRKLKPGDFYAYGPAFNVEEVTKVSIIHAQSTHPKVGKRLFEPPKPSEALKKALKKIGDLPTVVAEERDNVEHLQTLVRNLQTQLHDALAHPAKAEPKEVVRDVIPDEVREAAKKLVDKQAGLRKAMMDLERAMDESAAAHQTLLSEIQVVARYPVQKRPRVEIKPRQAQEAPGKAALGIAPEARLLDMKAPGRGENRILAVLCAVRSHPMRSLVMKVDLAIASGFRHNSGTFSNYLSSLKTKGLIMTHAGGGYSITQAGIDVVPVAVTPSREQMLGDWKQIMGGATGRMLETIVQVGEQGISKTDLADSLSMSATSGTFSNYISKLNSARLIEKKGPVIIATDLLLKGL